MLIIGTNTASLVVQQNGAALSQRANDLMSAEDRFQITARHSTNELPQTEQPPRVVSTQPTAENRFQNLIAQLALENSLTTANSRIIDTDFAQEAANLTKNQILQQAGIAMLSQANSQPQSVLALLSR